MPSSSDLQTLIAYVLGDLEPRLAEPVREAMVTDEPTRRILAEVRAMLALLRDQAPTLPPPDLARRLAALHLARPLTAPHGFDPDIQGVLAHLVADSREEALTGYRGELTAYHLTFEAGGAEVHLQITPSPSSTAAMLVRGQVEPDSDASVHGVRFVSVRDGSAIDATLDDTGFFSATVGVGVYDLHVTVDHRLILIPAVEVG